MSDIHNANLESNLTNQGCADLSMQIRNRDDLETLESICQGDDSSDVRLSLVGVEQLSTQDLQALFRLLSTYHDRFQFMRTDGHSTIDAFEALIEAIPESASHDTVQRLYIELAGALSHEESELNHSVTRVQNALRGRRIRVPRGLDSSIRQAAARYHHAGEGQPPIIEIIQQLNCGGDLPEVDSDLVLPRGWIYDPQSRATTKLFGADHGRPNVSLSGLLFVSQKSVDPSSGEEQVVLIWIHQGQLRRIPLKRQQLLVCRQAELLCAYGLPVSTLNKDLFVSYFSDYFRDNDFRLTTNQASCHLGWQAIGETPVFAWGDRIISSSSTDTSPQTVQLDESDSSFRELRASFTQAGTSDESLQLLREVSSYPSVWFTLMASLAGGLLEPLSLRPFIVDVCGETSSGKSILLMICASLWGRPDLHGGQSVIKSWSTTRVFVERYAAMMRSITVFLDDSKQVTRDEIVSQICYDLTNGHGKGRGTVTGLVDQTAWNLAAISTGEQSLISFGEHAGCRARVITLRGSPFPERNTEWRSRVDSYRRRAELNFGHVAPQFIQHVINHHAEWPQWRERIEALKTDMEPIYAQNPVAGRQLEYLALITLTAELFCEWFEFPESLRRPVAGIQAALVSEYQEADRPLEALERLLDHVAANPRLIQDQEWLKSTSFLYSSYNPMQIIGRRVNVQGDPHGTPSLAIFQNDFTSLMEELGFSKDEVLTAWKQRGWLHFDDNRNLKSVRVESGAERRVVRCVCIRAEVIEEQLRIRQQQANELVVVPLTQPPHGVCCQSLPG